MIPQFLNDNVVDVACAVIEQAILDATGHFNGESSYIETTRIRIKEDAINFLLGRGIGYKESRKYWFEVAGITYFKNYKQIEEAAKNVVYFENDILNKKLNAV